MGYTTKIAKAVLSAAVNKATAPKVMASTSAPSNQCYACGKPVRRQAGLTYQCCGKAKCSLVVAAKF